MTPKRHLSVAGAADVGEDVSRKLTGLRRLQSRWIERISFDQRFTDFEARTATRLVYKYLCRKPSHPRFGMIWCAATKAAQELNVSERAIRTVRRRLCTNKYFQQIEAGGGRVPGIYRLILPIDEDNVAESSIEGPCTAALQEEAASPATRCTPALFRAAADTKEKETVREETNALTRERVRERVRACAREKRPTISVDWQPNEDDIRFALQQRHDMTWIADAAERFRDYHLAKGSRLADPSAAWRNFVRRAGEFGPFTPSCTSEVTPAVDRQHQLDDAGDLLREQLGDVPFRVWFSEVECVGMEGDKLTLSVPSALVKQWLTTQYQQAIIDCWRRTHSKNIERLEIIVQKRAGLPGKNLAFKASPRNSI